MFETLAPPAETFCEGTVEAIDKDTCRVAVEGTTVSAAVTILGYRPSPGDRVLVTRRRGGRGWIVGVLDSRERPEAAENELRTAAGHTVRVCRDEQGERIELRDPESRLLLQFEPETGRAEIHVPEGDLRLAAPAGHVELVAGRGVRCVGRESVVMLAGGTDEGTRSSALRLDEQEAALCGERLDLSGNEAELQIDRVTYTGTHLEARVGRARWFVGRLESTVHRLVERLKAVYRTVEDVQQVRAGRMRTLVRGAHHLKAESSVIRTEDDLKLDGRRIHLG